MPAARNGLTQTGGAISPEAWQEGLDWLAAGGLDPAITGSEAASAASFEAKIDLSYLRSASEQP